VKIAVEDVALAFDARIALLTEPREKLSPASPPPEPGARVSRQVVDAIRIGLQVVEFRLRAFAERELPISAGFPRSFHRRLVGPLSVSFKPSSGFPHGHRLGSKLCRYR